jgi:hypothetical protein
MAGIARMRRSRGGLSGLLLTALGLWGALIPFVGPYFHYAYTPDRAWAFSSGRLWLSVVPGAAVALGGLLVLVTSVRPVAVAGALVAAAGGAWFAVGAAVIGLAGRAASITPGAPAGTGVRLRLLEQLGFYTGLGVVVAFLAAVALGRCTVVGVRDAVVAAGGDDERSEEEAGAGAQAGYLSEPDERVERIDTSGLT